MDWILSLLLLYTVEVRPAPVDQFFRQAHARAHGVEILRGKRVLMFGDSMVNCGINVWLEPWLKHHGVRSYSTHSWASSTTVSWAKTPKLQAYMWKFDPDIVIIVLGSNELFHPYPRMKIRPIRAILKKMGKHRLVYWVGPPAWKPDKGIIAVMKAQMPPGHFFDSSKLTLGRQKDGYHPNMAGSKTWAHALQRWLVERMNAVSAAYSTERSAARVPAARGRGAAARSVPARPRPRGPRRPCPTAPAPARRP